MVMGMYIRSVSQTHKKNGEVYTSYRLVESYRNAAGQVRQEMLLNLGNNFSFPKEKWKLLADRIEEIYQGQLSLFDGCNDACEMVLEQEARRIVKLLMNRTFASSESQKKQVNARPQPAGKAKDTAAPVATVTDTSGTDALAAEADAADYQTVNVNSLTHQDVRHMGAEHVSVHAAKQLHLPEILADCGFNQKQMLLALGTVIGRLVHPGSERSTHAYLQEQSALDELLETDFSALSLKRFYQISDTLLQHKNQIEERLYQREHDLFSLTETVTLFDLTNTYFEGTGRRHSKARYGRSKEKRRDCPLVTLGMVLDSSGFPKRSEIFAGNISEPGTLKTMLERLRSSTAKPTIVMDAGICTRENKAWLHAEGYHYIGVSRKKNLTLPPDAIQVLIKETTHNTVRAALVSNEETGEQELYCHSTAKEAKSTAMLTQSASRYEEALQQLHQGLSKKNGTKAYDKILLRLGRLKEKYRQTSHLYTVTVNTDQAEHPEKKTPVVTAITWIRAEADIEQKQKGVYCLCSNRTDLSAERFWNIYVMLTDLESAFRSLKSELGLRPIYHQKEHRIDGHLFISVLAYHLLHTIRMQLKAKGRHENWNSIRSMLSTHCRISSSLKLKDGRTVHIRKTAFPSPKQAAIYNSLNIPALPLATSKTYA
jgi:transposase